MTTNKVLWHVLSTTEALSKMNSSQAGLTPEEAGTRLQRFGPKDSLQNAAGSILGFHDSCPYRRCPDFRFHR
jgi:hypothetical protein